MNHVNNRNSTFIECTYYNEMQYKIYKQNIYTKIDN